MAFIFAAEVRTQMLRRRRLEWNCDFAFESLGLSKFKNASEGGKIVKVDQKLATEAGAGRDHDGHLMAARSIFFLHQDQKG